MSSPASDHDNPPDHPNQVDRVEGHPAGGAGGGGQAATSARAGSEPETDVRTYTLRPLPPIRAFALAAALSLAGAVLVAVAASRHAATLWLALAALVLALGIFLVLAGLVSMVRLRSFVDLTDDGYTLRMPGAAPRSGAWDDVTRVTQSMDGAHLTLYHGQVERTHILSPGNVATDQMEALAKDIAARLDKSRGYRTLSAVELSSGSTDDPGVTA